MSVLIKGMDMPQAGDMIICGQINGKLQCTIVTRGKSTKWCEASEVSAPHGRLIDADKLKETIESIYGGALWTFDCFELINDEDEVPTVIEAENSSAIDDDVKKYCDYLKSETYDFCNRIENGEVSE